METRKRRRLPALIAGTVVASGITAAAAAVAPSRPTPRATASAAERVTVGSHVTPARSAKVAAGPHDTPARSAKVTPGPHDTPRRSAKVTPGSHDTPRGSAKVTSPPAVAPPVSGDARVCATEQGKYRATVVTTFPVVGDMGAPKGRQGGTLVVMGSTVCGTVWVEVKKDAKYDKRAYPTSASIATYATTTDRSKVGESHREAITRAVLSTKAIPLRAHGRIEVKAGWAGKGFRFNGPVHVIRY
ncbi:hypothetical protein [Actinoallomurus sp. NPDC050550]|uniref:hypothetical protein n=1 Tax=Actinoallomurus sp. NPDC050550 TaxID=3154937 RepID=UPI00340457B8